MIGSAIHSEFQRVTSSTLQLRLNSPQEYLSAINIVHFKCQVSGTAVSKVTFDLCHIFSFFTVSSGVI